MLRVPVGGETARTVSPRTAARVRDGGREGVAAREIEREKERERERERERRRERGATQEHDAGTLTGGT